MKWILPVLFTGYFLTVSLFEHTHVVDGVTIVHSHPFKSLPGGGAHQHSNSQFQLFYFLSHFSAPDHCVSLLTLQFNPVLLFRYAVPLASPDFLSRAEGVLSARAPPFSVLF